MKKQPLFLLAALCCACFLVSACTTCQTQQHEQYGYHEQHHKNKEHKKHKMHKQEPVVFQQNYKGDDVKKVKANMSTKNSQGGTTEMGTIWFTETDNGLQMNADLMYLRPNKTYTAQIYQCGACNDNTCCAMEAMSVDLPQLKVNNSEERLQQTYIIRGLTAAQLNNAKLILVRDGGYKAAWGTLKQ